MATKTQTKTNAKTPAKAAAKKADPKAAKPDPKSDVISRVVGVTSVGNHTVVEAPGHESLLINPTHFIGQVQKLAVVGGSFKAVTDAVDHVKANPPAAKLARGVDGHNSPQSAEAVKQTAEKARKSAPKADPKAKKEARKADRAAKAAPKADDTRKITTVKKDFAFGREGTARRASWDKCLKAKTAAEYIKSGGAAKYLPRWASAGAIKLG